MLTVVVVLKYIYPKSNWYLIDFRTNWSMPPQAKASTLLQAVKTQLMAINENYTNFDE